MSRRLPPRIRANRQNAKKSTGPKTPAGKARSAQNAKIHGLNTPITRSPFSQERAIELTRTIAGAEPSAQCLEAARELAAAQVNVERARRAHEAILADHAEQIAAGRTTTADGPNHQRGDNSSIEQLMNKVKALPRYEKRALSRRKRAFRAFEKTVKDGEA
jgi:hypothetical protein